VLGFILGFLVTSNIAGSLHPGAYDYRQWTFAVEIIAFILWCMVNFVLLIILLYLSGALYGLSCPFFIALVLMLVHTVLVWAASFIPSLFLVGPTLFGLLGPAYEITVPLELMVQILVLFFLVVFTSSIGTWVLGSVRRRGYNENLADKPSSFES
jgi:small-conductance mechanosensitive channel